ncbi:MAG: putative toxin-antitoxin system toxin component, PIN family [Candidatus Bathyarchaeota archaeon]
MITVVLDTNVLISALIKTGKPRTLVFTLIRGKTRQILSREILDEFARTARDPELQKYFTDDDATGFLRIIGSIAKIVKVKSRFNVIRDDPSDNAILRTAYDGKADYLVSGDNPLLALKEFKGIKIVTINEILEILQ